MSEQDLNLVPGKDHYAAEYVRGGRLFSYAHQMNAVLEHRPQTVVEIGPGPGMVTAALRAIDVDVTTVDIQPELKPDVVASVTDLPFDGESFDVAMCCQVLEHLPLEQFVPALSELARVSRKAVVVSLPEARPHYELAFRLPGLQFKRVVGSRPKRVPQGRIQRVWAESGHYWEIGYPDTSLRAVLRAFGDAGLRVQRHWRPTEMTYHHFFHAI